MCWILILQSSECRIITTTHRIIIMINIIIIIRNTNFLFFFSFLFFSFIPHYRLLFSSVRLFLSYAWLLHCNSLWNSPTYAKFIYFRSWNFPSMSFIIIPIIIINITEAYVFISSRGLGVEQTDTPASCISRFACFIIIHKWVLPEILFMSQRRGCYVL